MSEGNDCSPEQERRLARLALTAAPVDVLVLGGGVTGTAIAYLAALSGLQVAVAERDALGAGTSGRSSGFAHGGLRYLARGRIGLVRAMLRARAELARIGPHLVRPAPFLLPLPGALLRSHVLRAALSLYQRLDTFDWPGHRAAARLSPAAVLAAEPALAGARAESGGGLVYPELTVDGARLACELAQGAREAGALVVTGLTATALLAEDAHLTRVAFRDGESGAALAARARVVVNATGPSCVHTLARFADGGARLDAPPRLRLSRGTHILVSPHRLPLRHTVVFFSPSDGRALFASPRPGHVLVGTTDTEHRGGPEDARPTEADVRYLLAGLAAAFPAASLGEGDVTGAFAATRPLDAGRVNGSPHHLGALDRRYALAWQAPRLLSIWGGKLTLCLPGARQVLGALHARRAALGLPAFAVPAVTPPLPGARPPQPRLSGSPLPVTRPVLAT